MFLFFVSHLIVYVPESLSVSGDSITDWPPVLLRKHIISEEQASLIRPSQAMTYIVCTTSEPLMKRQREYLDVCSSEMVSLVPVHRFKLTGSAEPKLSSSLRHVPWRNQNKRSKKSSINNLWSILKKWMLVRQHKPNISTIKTNK